MKRITSYFNIVIFEDVGPAIIQQNTKECGDLFQYTVVDHSTRNSILPKNSIFPTFVYLRKRVKRNMSHNDSS